MDGDGSFTYRPADGFAGTDSFTYQATDGASRSGVVTVEILVKDTAKPTVESVAPAGRRVSPTKNVTVAFSEAMDAATITTATVKLAKKGAGSPVRAGVTYSPATNTATLDPAKSLKKGATYTAKVTTGAKAWSFTVKK